MYNRYIPRPDGTYQRNPVKDQSMMPESKPATQPLPPLEVPFCSQCVHNQPGLPPPPPHRKQTAESVSIGRFLKQLLPRDFDAEDLLVLILLMLMSGDCREDHNTALLTLVLYLFL